MGAEMMAKKFDLSKDALDEYAFHSHQRAIAATKSGTFEAEVLPIEIVLPDGSKELHRIDEGIRFDANLEAIRGVKLLAEGGRITAATVQPDRRRRLRRHGRQRQGAEGARRAADGAHSSHDGHRARPGDHAGSADSGDRAGAQEGRHEVAGHRPVRSERSVRIGAGRLAAATATRIRTSSTSTAARSRSDIRSAHPAPS
jgi:acetyl-CoA acetyltransferase